MLEVGKDETHQAKRKNYLPPPSSFPFPPSQRYAYKGKPLTLAHLAEGNKASYYEAFSDVS